MPQPKSGHWSFHPVVQTWFDKCYSAATPCQQQAWPAVQQQRDVLVCAPTGSGKTLAAFLAVIDELIQLGLNRNGLPDATLIVYVSPLKALSYDIERNLLGPLAGIRQELVDSGYPDFTITTGVRTGDTTQSERQKMARKPPHILVTTPESFYLLLTSDSGRNILQSASRLIVDEIHALAGNKRGAHFSLSMARFEHLIAQPPLKIGLSATQKPLSQIASYLTGRLPHQCTIVDTGHVREWDLGIRVPAMALEAVTSAQAWADIYVQIAKLIDQHRATLIFVNTRRHVERATRFLAELMDEDQIGSHHGSLSKEHRHKAEQDLKRGNLRALVATASLELGIDIGDVDLVCQIGSPRSIAVFLQRVGRSGHAIDRTPKGRLFPTTRDELVESVALLKAVSNGDLEALEICGSAMDVLAQQIVAETCTRDCEIDELFRLFKSAYPYRHLSEESFHDVLRMLNDGFTFRRGRRNAYIHLDAVNRVLRARRGARIAAATNAGVIPDLFDYDVILTPGDIRIGAVNEDFAFESLAGDIFQLGNTSYRIIKVAKGIVQVEDAKGQPPNIPFWIGEGRGRSQVLSQGVSDLREFVQTLLERTGETQSVKAFQDEYQVDESVAEQVVNYLDAARTALGLLPTRKTIVLERFFDATGDAHLIVHSVYGSRLNKAWGLALRKRFCVRFNFELQAAALEDNFILSLGPTHSFALEEVQNYVKSKSSKEVLSQAVLGAPMFATRWRWAANTALAVLKFNRGQKVPPPFQRNDSEDLLSLVFPDQVACQENITGPIEIPDHPLIQQTLTDCLQEVMDAKGLSEVLEGIEKEKISVVCRDLSEPSALTHEVLTAKPYAFLDDAPAEERRTLAVQTRRLTGTADVAEFGRFDADAVESVAKERWPIPKDVEQLHDALVQTGFFAFADSSLQSSDDPEAFLTDPGEHQCRGYFEHLTNARRATELTLPGGIYLWVAAERLAALLLLHPDAQLAPKIEPATFGQPPVTDPHTALVDLIGSRLATVGPRTVRQLSASIQLPEGMIEGALLALETEGSVMRGHFTEPVSETQWCERNYLARLHKSAISKLRNQIKPVDARQYMRFLARWMRLTPETIGEGPETLSSIISSLEGFEAPAGVWESDILSARSFKYTPEILDYLNATGRFVWCRLSAPAVMNAKHSEARIYRQRTSIRKIPLTFLKRNRLFAWKALAEKRSQVEPRLSGKTRLVLEAFTDYGPLFFEEIQEELGLLPVHVEESLVELFALGLATCDHFGGIRSLLAPESKRRRRSMLGRLHSHAVQSSGRWSVLVNSRRKATEQLSEDDLTETAAKALLNRYGIVFYDLLAREGKFMPSWRQLRRYLARLEDRGEVRGGRFVEGVGGEQFALPQAIELLRSVRQSQSDRRPKMIHSSDPYNLSSLIAPGDLTRSVHPNACLVFEDGQLIKVSDRPHTMKQSTRKLHGLV